MKRRTAKKLCLTIVMAACIAVLCVTASSLALTDYPGRGTAVQDAPDQPAAVVIPAQNAQEVAIAPEESPTENIAAPNEQITGADSAEPQRARFLTIPKDLKHSPCRLCRSTTGMHTPSFMGGEPFFDPDEFDDRPFEFYPALDELGRCGTTMACVGKEPMPTEERDQIGMIKPSGWHTIRYDDLIEDHYLYNRCHLIGYQLTGENANERNLVTGTRYLNAQGMLPIENKVAEYIRKTGNHVLYRVTPAFDGEDLLAKGILIEARSVEDAGAGICLCLFAYNVQPGVVIDYATGDSWRANPE